jgi:hypothetical protein
MKNALKALAKDGISIIMQSLGRPHNRTRFQVARAYARLNPAIIQEQRITAIARATGEALSTIQEYERLVRESMPNAFDEYSQVQQWRVLRADMMGLQDRLSLGVLTLATLYETYVETGAGAGASSAMILQAIAHHKRGRLVSIDLDNHLAARYGELIPNEFRPYWDLRLQKATPLLPAVLAELKVIDFFLHDSRHVVQHMRWEYELAWQSLRAGGCLASHDIFMTTAFYDFASAHRHEIMTSGEIGSFGFFIKR